MRLGPGTSSGPTGHVGPKMPAGLVGLKVTMSQTRPVVCRALMGPMGPMGLEGRAVGADLKVGRTGPAIRSGGGPGIYRNAEPAIRSGAGPGTGPNAEPGIRSGAGLGTGRNAAARARLAGLRGYGVLTMRGSGARLILMGCRERASLT